MEINVPNLLGYVGVFKNIDVGILIENIYEPRFWKLIFPFEAEIEKIGVNRLFIQFKIHVLIEAEVTLVNHGRDNSGTYVIEIYTKPNKHIERFDARIRIRELRENQIKIGFFVQEFIPRSKILIRRKFRTMMLLRKNIREAIGKIDDLSLIE